MGDTQTNTQTIKTLHTQGFTILPTLPGKKHPASWKQHKTTPPTLEQTLKLFKNTPNHGYCILTGYNHTHDKCLIMLELEAKATTPTILQKLETNSIYKKLMSGWWETSNSGGLHYYITLDANDIQDTEKIKNMKLSANNDGEVLAETRGEGGLSVIAPTQPIGQNGKGWTLNNNTYTPTRLTWAEYVEILDLYANININIYQNTTNTPNTPKNTTINTNTNSPNMLNTYISVFDDYEQKTSWEQILTPHGWQKHSTTPQETNWTRPNKNPTDGISATTGKTNDRDRLYIFTTSTTLPTQTPLTKPYVYAQLNHAGNLQNAYNTLKQQGYGTQNNNNNTNNDDVDGYVETLDMLGQIELSDKFTQHTHKTLKYNTDNNRWYIYNKNTGCWEKDSREHTKTMNKLKTYVQTLPTRQDKKTKPTYNTLASVLKFSATNPQHTINTKQFDTHPHLINTPKNIINLKTGQTLPHNPEHYFTKTTLTHPNTNQPTPKFTAFINDTFKNDTQIIEYVQTFLGYCASGETGEQILAFWLGVGKNGKSVLAELILNLLADYGRTASDTLLIKHPYPNEYEIMTLQGARVAIASEIDPDATFDEQKVKKITGGDKLIGRQPYEPYTEFENKAKIIILANHQPTVKRGGASFWRRMRVIDFPNVVPTSKQNPNLLKELIGEEAQGILAWVLQGAKNYYLRGLRTPESVMAVTKEYEESEDHINAFIKQECEIGGGVHVTTATEDLRNVYVNFCHREGFTPLEGRKLGRELKKVGVERKQVRVGDTRKYRYINVRLKDGM